MNDLGDRRTYIGGSDIASIIGASPWKSIEQLYAEKTSPKKIENKPSLLMEIGTTLESLIKKKALEHFERKHKEKKIQINPLNLTHPKYDFLKAHIDGILYINDKPSAILEFKYSTRKWDTIPKQYIVQTVFYQEMFQKILGTVLPIYLIKLTPYGDFEIKTVHKNDFYKWHLGENLITEAKLFWEMHVKPKIPVYNWFKSHSDISCAPIDPSNPSTELINDNMIDNTIIANEKHYNLYKQYTKLNEEEKAIKKQKDEIKNQIMHFLTKEKKDTLLSFNKKQLIKISTMKRNVLDTKALKEKEPEIYSKYIKESSNITLKCFTDL